MGTSIKQIVEVMEKIAPSWAAEPWDNVGLHVGSKTWSVDSIWVGLDPTIDLVEKASGEGANLVITHHPLIFEPLQSLNPDSVVGRIVAVALRNRLGIFCAHTNLDSVRGGLNDMLGERLGVLNTTVLKAQDTDQHRLVVYVPVGYEDKVARAMFEYGAGMSPKYSDVAFKSEGIGTFKPGAEAKPFMGREGEVSYVREHRLEVLVANQHLSRVVGALNAAHPYDEAVYDVFPVKGGRSGYGLGRIGDLAEEMPLGAFVQQIKEALRLKTVKITGDREKMVKRVALCSGSGKSLLKEFLDSEAQVYVSGDFGYHDGRFAEDLGRALVDIGHFASEHIVVDGLVERLEKAFMAEGLSVEVVPFKEEQDCFEYV